MELSLVLCLPRDEKTVPVARHIVRHAMREVGVESECVSDVEVALSEACTNVLVHSGPGDEYDVRFDLEDDKCVLRVVDVGRGIDARDLATDGPQLDAERGRGLHLMNALVDRVQFASRPDRGTVVHLEKNLVFENTALLGQDQPSSAS
jgi:serine/threonine-protein kinase RsbW